MLSQQFYHKTMQSPVGPLRLVASAKGLCAVLFQDGRTGKAGIKDESELKEEHPVLLKTEKQLNEYFKGTRQDFDLPIDAHGTVFQIKAWRQLSKIPYARTISYGEQAKGLGDAKKARAVGMANGRNPICIIIPCHRVIGASGALTGFGGGLKTKEWLLNHEKNVAGKALAA
jgi:methylated-DNA-[protein]-cysteine S-methyltransferase